MSVRLQSPHLSARPVVAQSQSFLSIFTVLMENVGPHVVTQRGRVAVVKSVVLEQNYMALGFGSVGPWTTQLTFLCLSFFKGKNG